MSDNLKFYKGLEQDLPRSNIQIGAIYHCEDTGNTYRGVSANTMELFSTSALTINAKFEDDQIVEVSSSIGDWDDFWSHAAFKCKDLQMKIYAPPEEWFFNLIEKYEDKENHDNSYMIFGGKIKNFYYLIWVDYSGAYIESKSSSFPISKYLQWDVDLGEWRTDSIASWSEGTRFFFTFDLEGYKYKLSKDQSAMGSVFDGLESIPVRKSRPSVPYEFFQSVQEFIWANDCLYHVGAIPVEKQGIRVGVGHTADASYLTKPKEDKGTGLQTPVLVGVMHNFDQSDNDITAFVNREAPILADLARGILKPYGGLEGNASSATKLETARTFSFSGDVVDTSASFDGSANPSITLTLGNSGVTAGNYGPSTNAAPGHSGTFSVPYITVDAKGRVTSISSKTITLPSDNNTTYSAGNGLSLSGTTFSVKASTGIAVSNNGVALATSGATAGTYGAASSPAHGGTFAIPSITVDAYGRVTKATTVNVTLPADSNTDTKVKQNAAITTKGNYPVILGYSTATTAVTNTVNKCAAITANPSTGALTATKVYGAVWNDYAEYRQSDVTEPGRVVCENGDDTLSLSTQRLQPGAEVISDTFGFAIGETDIAKTPIAVSGRVLVYTYEDRNTYQPGDAVCAAPGGTVSKMTRDEIVTYPERIIGTVSAVPSYETWGTNNIAVNNRIWIKIK